jgi:CheY-like chemotaxis protein
MMTKELSKAKILIVEDHIGNRDTIFRALMDAGIPAKQIETTDNSGEAKSLIDDFEPNVVLLDLTIMGKSGGEEDVLYSYEVIEKVRLYNHENPEQIEIIIISGTIENENIQKILHTEGENITGFIDKAIMSSDRDQFKEKLIKNIAKALRDAKEGKHIEFSNIRNSNLRLLKKLHVELWEKIEEEVLENIARLDLKKVNEHNVAKNIIISCGQIVEIVIYYLEGSVKSVREINFSDNPVTVRNKLNRLSGRKFNNSAKSYEIIDENPIISKKASEYAYRAYTLRNHAGHAPEIDNKNKNIFKDTRFDKWDAIIALDLVMPLLNEYIKRLKEKNS